MAETTEMASGPPHLDRVRRICLALPEATEKEAWRAPTFRVRKRMFASYALNHHNDGRVAMWCHAPEGLQQALVAAEPEKFFRPPYLGPSGWIGLNLDQLDDGELETFARQAYCMVAPQKLQKQLP
jgi:hypothetical protein